MKGIRLTNEEFIKKAELVHENKYDYSKTKYITYKKKVIILCHKHGEFFQVASNHLMGGGCRKCRNEYFSLINTSCVEDFVDKSKKLHGDKYDYSNVKYVSGRKKVEIKCPVHGLFYQQPTIHLTGSGCPICRSSRGELRVIRFLKDNNIEYIQHKTFDGCKNPKTNYKLQFDFYIPFKNILIEYDGRQHFDCNCTIYGQYTTTEKDLEEIKYRDAIKTDYAKKSNVKLIRIKYTQFKRIEEIMREACHL